MKENIGYNIEFKPETTCDDKNCPFHGSLSIRGKTFEGTIVSDLMDKTVKVEWESLEKFTKYLRYFKKTSKVSAHNPACVNAKKGDKVIIGECRPLSKTKHFTVLKVIEQ